MHSNWRHHSNSDRSDNDDAKYVGEKDDDLESCCSVQTQAFAPKQTKRHRYNLNNKFHEYNRRYNNQRSRYNKPQPQRIKIKPNWKHIRYDKTQRSSQYKIGQIIKYGQYCKITATLTEYTIFYGTRVLHMDIYGDVIGLYEGGWNCWENWFWYFLGGNTVYDLDVFKRIDLFGSAVICGINFVHKDAYALLEGVCKKGWLEGVKHMIETLHINPIDNKFDLLIQTAYRFNSDVLRYLLIENNFYQYFDIDHKKNKYGETLWSCCRDQFKAIIAPGSGWLHCLESLHYAPYLIYELHPNVVHKHVQHKDEMEGNIDDVNNWMICELEDIESTLETIEIPSEFVHERLNIISNITHNKPETFKLESCFYGLCVDAAGSKPHCIHFWKPHAARDRSYPHNDTHSFEYVPCNTDDDKHWGRLKMTVYRKLNEANIMHGCWLTVVPHKNIVKLCQIREDDTQLWKIKQIELQNGDNIWIQIINKLGYKLIFAWNPSTRALNSSMPLLSLSKKVNEIHSLCVDLFSVARNVYSTRYAFYLTKYGRRTNDVLSGIGGRTNRNSFWRLTADGTQFDDTKDNCYRSRVRNIARIIWQFKQRYAAKKEDEMEEKYNTQDISCPGCKHNVIVCKEYWNETCAYGHAKKSNDANGSRLFCEYGDGCTSMQCNRRHDFKDNAQQLSHIKCPFECGRSVCKNINVCPYFHDGRTE